MDKHFRVSDARHSGFAMRIGLECGFILKDDGEERADCFA